ncbi:MAG: ATP-binding cassette domain-containing protein [Spirochaetaceae bacterium]|jgi:energy-coupling factor transport system ATP-binding protein|nr:ATP-binding cassette domain-containing protein [Spirochaetaceae bacterium]
MISAQNVDYRYPSGKRALSGINLSVERGEFVAVVGHNGSGKSTLALLLSGLEYPTKGEVTVNGISTRQKNRFLELRKQVGIVFQNPENQLVFEKVRDDITFGLKNIGLEQEAIDRRIDAITRKLHIEHFTDSFALSMGQKQRVAIASVLAMEPECIIFDEPTAMLDPKGKKEIHKVIVELHEQGLTIVYVTNVIDEVLSADRIVILENGVIKGEYRRGELFDNIGHLREAGLEPPLIMDLLFRLKQRGVNVVVKRWAIEDVVDELAGYIEQCRAGPSGIEQPPTEQPRTEQSRTEPYRAVPGGVPHGELC